MTPYLGGENLRELHHAIAIQMQRVAKELRPLQFIEAMLVEVPPSIPKVGGLHGSR